MRRVLLGTWAYLEFGVCLLTWVPLLGAIRLLRPGDLRLRGRWMRRFGRATSRLNPLWRFSVEGTAPPDALRRAYVVVANHESTADPFLLSFLPWDMRWVAKEEIFRMPVIGALMRSGGDIRLRRGDGESVRAMMREARATLDRGLPVMMFPEGTRTADGSLGPFKDGAFQLALETGAPILPLAIVGTRACRPKGSRWFGRADARVRVLAPIATDGLGRDDLPRVRELARARIAEALEEMRGGDDRAARSTPVPVELAPTPPRAAPPAAPPDGWFVPPGPPPSPPPA